MTGMQRVLVCGAVALSLAAGCGPGGEAPRRYTGTVSMALTATNGSTTYRLVGATFDVTGPVSQTVSPAPGDAIFKLELPAGDYTIKLRDGWTMQSSTGGAPFAFVEAALAGPASQDFTIFAQEVTHVRFSFRAGAEVMAFGDGQLSLEIGVNEGGDPTACNVAHPSCGVSTVTCSGHRGSIGGSCAFSTGPAGTTLTCNGSSTTIPSGFGANPNGYGLAARRLADLQGRLLAFFEAHGAFPVGTAPPTPAATCCGAGGVTECPANPAAWHGVAAWDSIGFSIETAHTFVYSIFAPSGTEAHVIATGDLDCDAASIDYSLDCTATNGNPSCTLTLPVPCPGSDYE